MKIVIANKRCHVLPNSLMPMVRERVLAGGQFLSIMRWLMLASGWFNVYGKTTYDSKWPVYLLMMCYSFAK